MKKLILLSALAIVACGPPPAENEAAPTVVKPAPINPDSLSEGFHSYKDAQGHKMMEGEIRNTKRHGIWTTYHGNGKVMSRSEYRKGLLEGPTVVFRENGGLYYDGQYRHGKEVGSWRFYDPAGQLERTAVYDTTGRPVQ